MARQVGLYSAGVAEVLRSLEMRRVVDELTDAVAQSVQDHPAAAKYIGAGESGMDVQVRSVTTDRAAGRVTLAGPMGLRVQLKHGVFEAAAGAHGLQVKDLAAARKAAGRRRAARERAAERRELGLTPKRRTKTKPSNGKRGRRGRRR